MFNGEDNFLNKFVNFHVHLFTLWSRLQLCTRQTDGNMSYKLFLLVVIRKIIFFYTKRGNSVLGGGCEMEDRREGGRGSFSSFVSSDV